MSELELLSDKDVPYWSFAGTYIAKITDVYDGDTVHAIFKFGDKHIKLHVRLVGYDCPEMRSSNAELKKKAYEARDYLRSLILGKIVKLQLGEFDKYGRTLGDIFIETYHINKDMAEKYGIFGRPEYNNYIKR